jgi:hypothetical protein
VLDLGQDEASLELAEAERLAEDLRPGGIHGFARLQQPPQGAQMKIAVAGLSAAEGRYAECWIWARMRPASNWRRRSGWRKICACCTSP